MRCRRTCLLALCLVFVARMVAAEFHPFLPAWEQGFSKTQTAWNYNIYDRRGPYDWQNIPGYRICGGRTQSPINIRTSEVRFNPKHQLIFLGVPSSGFFSKHVTGFLNNTGKAPKFVPQGDRFVCITGVPYRGDDSFCLNDVHVHFSSQDHAGSEHSVDGDKFAGEIHFVFYNDKYHADVASDMSDGITVIALFIKVRPFVFGSIPEYIERELPKIMRLGSSAPGIFPNLDFLRHDGRFYTYDGSLTAPPCKPTVRWIIRPEPVAITPFQMSILRSLEADTGGTIARLGNVRPSRPRNNRLVEANFPQDSRCSCRNYHHGNPM